MNDFVMSQYNAISVCQMLDPQVPMIGGDVGFLLAGVPIGIKSLVVAAIAEQPVRFDRVLHWAGISGSDVGFQQGRVSGIELYGTKLGVISMNGQELVIEKSEVRMAPVCRNRDRSTVCLVGPLGSVLSEISLEICEARESGNSDLLTRLLGSWMCMYVLAAIENPEATFFAMFTELLESLNLADIPPQLTIGLIRFFSVYCSKTFAANMGCAFADAFRHSVGRMRSPKRKVKLPWKTVAEFQRDAMVADMI